jgi:precorrin-2 methylase
MYAYNYLKDPKDEQLLRDKFAAAGFEGFPSVFVHAAVCRPDLLCETEVLAVLPRTDKSQEKPQLVASNMQA